MAENSRRVDMARYRLDTNVAGAFMNIYMPIGNDPVVKSLDGYSAPIHEAHNPHQYVTLEAMIEQVDIGRITPSADPVLDCVKNKPKDKREEMQYRIDAIMTTYYQQPALQRNFFPKEYLRIRLAQYEQTQKAAK